MLLTILQIKVIDITKQKCETFAGSGSPGESCGNKLLEAQFNEPGGLCVTSDGHHAVIYVADTNNHCVKVINVQNQTINKVCILFLAMP